MILFSRKKATEHQPPASEKINALKNLRESLSQKTGIEPGFLMSNATIAAVALAQPSSEEELFQINGTRQWQIELLGKEVIKILNR
jgi:ribonuclease D